MYEVTLQTSGLMQIGWATRQCQMTLEVTTICGYFCIYRDFLEWSGGFPWFICLWWLQSGQVEWTSIQIWRGEIQHFSICSIIFLLGVVCGWCNWFLYWCRQWHSDLLPVNKSVCLSWHHHLYLTRNGKNLGVAFRNIRQGPGFAYFPAISNGPREDCTANFGNTPFRWLGWLHYISNSTRSSTWFCC